MDDKDLIGIMTMMRVFAAFWLTGSAHIKAMWRVDMHYLLWIFRYTSTNQAIIFFLVASWCSSIDKSCLTGNNITASQNERFEVVSNRD